MADGPVDKPARPQAPLLVFVHIPKTAGTAVRTVLGMNEAGKSIRPLSNVFKGGGGLDQGLITRLREGKRPLDLSRATVLTGHFPLGVREYLPNYVAEGREVRYFTFLREPVDRSLSHYFRIREKREGSSRQPKFARSPLPPDPTLDDMLEGGYVHDNLQTRMLSGLPEPFGEVTDEVLEQAKRNLTDALVCFGLTERFDESLVLAKHRLGFSSILYKIGSGRAGRRSLSPSGGRVNPGRPRGDDIPKDLLEAARACNRYDIELYRHAQELFESVPERGQLEFEVELAALRAAEAEGEIQVDAPVPSGFGGDEQAWRMLLHARASLLRRELELADMLRTKSAADGRIRSRQDSTTGARPGIEPEGGDGNAAGSGVGPVKRRPKGRRGGRQAAGGDARQGDGPKRRQSGKSEDGSDHQAKRAKRKAGRAKSKARHEQTPRPKARRAKKARGQRGPATVADVEESSPTNP